MNLRPALFIAACLMLAAARPAAAQFQTAPMQQQQPPCLTQFTKLRDDARGKAARIEAAGKAKQKPSPQVACRLFNAFSAAEAKLVKYADENSVWCGIPKEVITNMKAQHTKTSEIRTRICRAAAAPPRPRGPSLSDALAAPVPNADNIKTGRGTYDTLTGTPLGK
jgi:hypothetical protein